MTIFLPNLSLSHPNMKRPIMEPTWNIDVGSCCFQAFEQSNRNWVMMDSSGFTKAHSSGVMLQCKSFALDFILVILQILLFVAQDQNAFLATNTMDRFWIASRVNASGIIVLTKIWNKPNYPASSKTSLSLTFSDVSFWCCIRTLSTPTLLWECCSFLSSERLVDW